MPKTGPRRKPGVILPAAFGVIRPYFQNRILMEMSSGREASGLRPLERRFRADEKCRENGEFSCVLKAALKPSAVQTLRDQRTPPSQFNFEDTPQS